MLDSSATKARWHVVRVRPRCEKKIAHCSNLFDLAHYLPLRQETKVYQRRRVTVHKPLFLGYIFVSFDWEGRLGLLKSNMIAQILPVKEQRKLLHELAQIRRALRADPGLKACVGLTNGHRVRIKGGPFMGVEGMIADARRRDKVLLNVEILGQAVCLYTQGERLELLD